MFYFTLIQTKNRCCLGNSSCKVSLGFIHVLFSIEAHLRHEINTYKGNSDSHNSQNYFFQFISHNTEEINQNCVKTKIPFYLYSYVFNCIYLFYFINLWWKQASIIFSYHLI